jgi:hypothetical protein
MKAQVKLQVTLRHNWEVDNLNATKLTLKGVSWGRGGDRPQGGELPRPEKGDALEISIPGGVLKATVVGNVASLYHHKLVVEGQWEGKMDSLTTGLSGAGWWRILRLGEITSLWGKFPGREAYEAERVRRQKLVWNDPETNPNADALTPLGVKAYEAFDSLPHVPPSEGGPCEYFRMSQFGKVHFRQWLGQQPELLVFNRLEEAESFLMRTRGRLTQRIAAAKKIFSNAVVELAAKRAFPISVGGQRPTLAP